MFVSNFLSGRKEFSSLLYCWDYELILVYSPDFDRLCLWALLCAALRCLPFDWQHQPCPVPFWRYRVSLAAPEAGPVKNHCNAMLFHGKYFACGLPRHTNRHWLGRQYSPLYRDPRLKSIGQCHFQWPWMAHNPHFKVTPVFDAQYIVNAR